MARRRATISLPARQHYGRPDFEPIVRANPQEIVDPDLIHPGQVLRIPIGTG